MDLGTLVATLKADITNLEKGGKKADAILKKYSKNTKKELQAAEKVWKSAGDGIHSAVTKMGLAIGGLLAIRGLYTLGEEIVQAGVRLESLSNAFQAVTGTSFEAGRELSFVAKTADTLGLSVRALEDSYKTLAAASMKTKLEGQGARDVFYSVAEASSAMQLTATQTHAALYALQQMMSKGRVQTEELRRQLGEQLPGAFQMAAQAMGVTTAQLNKMLETGKVISEDFLPKFAKVLHERFAVAAVRNADLARGAFNKFRNEVEYLKRDIAKSGLTDFVAQLARDATLSMKDLRNSLRDYLPQIVGFFNEIEKSAKTAFDGVNYGDVLDTMSELTILIEGTTRAFFWLIKTLGFVAKATKEAGQWWSEYFFDPVKNSNKELERLEGALRGVNARLAFFMKTGNNQEAIGRLEAERIALEEQIRSRKQYNNEIKETIDLEKQFEENSKNKELGIFRYTYTNDRKEALYNLMVLHGEFKSEVITTAKEVKKLTKAEKEYKQLINDLFIPLGGKTEDDSWMNPFTDEELKKAESAKQLINDLFIPLGGKIKDDSWMNPFTDEEIKKAKSAKQRDLDRTISANKSENEIFKKYINTIKKKNDASKKFVADEIKNEQDRFENITDFYKAQTKAFEEEERKKLLASNDFWGGFKLGMEDSKRDFQTWAQEGVRVSQQFANNASSTLSDSFFAILKGDMDQLSGIWEGFMDSMLRTLTDTVAKMAVQWGIGAIGGVTGWWDSGAWEIKKDHVAVVHKGEMIVPADIASKVRGGHGSDSVSSLAKVSPQGGHEWSGSSSKELTSLLKGSLGAYVPYAAQGVSLFAGGQIDGGRLLSGLLNPQAIATAVMSGGIPTLINDKLGMSNSKFGTIGQSVFSMLGGMLGGPGGAMVGGSVGGSLGMAFGDILNMRDNEWLRDYFEKTYGFFGSQKDMANQIKAFTESKVPYKEYDIGGFRNEERGRVSQGPSGQGLAGGIGGFAKGGLIDKLIAPGEDGLASVKFGEGVVSNDGMKALEKINSGQFNMGGSDQPIHIHIEIDGREIALAVVDQTRHNSELIESIRSVANVS